MLKKTGLFFIAAAFLFCGITMIIYVIPLSQISFAQNDNLPAEKIVPKNDDVKFMSLCPSVTLTLIDKDTHQAELDIKNESDKEILAFQLRLNGGSKIMSYTPTSSIFFEPHTTQRQKVFFPVGEKGKALPNILITLETILFIDGSAEGNLDTAKSIKNTMRGLKYQLKTLIPAMEELDSNLQAKSILDKTTSIKTAVRKTERLFYKTDDSFSDDFNAGIIYAQQSVSRAFNELEENLSKGERSQENSFVQYTHTLDELKDGLKRLSLIEEVK